MEKNISKKLRINAKETMKIAERLYTQGLISYPRTETNIFPDNLNLRPLVEQQTSDNEWGQFAQRILNDGGPHPRQGRKSDQVNSFFLCSAVVSFPFLSSPFSFLFFNSTIYLFVFYLENSKINCYLFFVTSFE